MQFLSEIIDHRLIGGDTADIPVFRQILCAFQQFIEHPRRGFRIFAALCCPHTLAFIQEIAQFLRHPWMFCQNFRLDTHQMHARHVTDIIIIGQLRTAEIGQHLTETGVFAKITIRHKGCEYRIQHTFAQGIHHRLLTRHGFNPACTAKTVQTICNRMCFCQAACIPIGILNPDAMTAQRSTCPCIAGIAPAGDADLLVFQLFKTGNTAVCTGDDATMTETAHDEIRNAGNAGIALITQRNVAAE